MFRTLAALALALILGLLGVLWLPHEAPAPTDPTGLQPAPASPDVHPLLDPRQSASERVISERIHWTWDGRMESPDAKRSFGLEQLGGLGGLAPGRYRFKVFPEDLLLEPAGIDVPAARELVELRWRLSH